MSATELLAIRILGAELYNQPAAAKNVVWLMRLTAQVGPFLFTGINFGTSTNGRGAVVALPSDGRGRRVVVSDVFMRDALASAASAAYLGLGGPEFHAAALLPLATAPHDMEPSIDQHS